LVATEMSSRASAGAAESMRHCSHCRWSLGILRQIYGNDASRGRDKVTSWLMWTAVLFLGFGMAIDPLRLGVVVVLVSRPKPILNLFACWLGGMVAGIALGVVVLVGFRDVVLLVIHSVMSVLTQLRSTVAILSGGGLQVTLGVLALLSVVVPLVRKRARDRALVAAGVAGGHTCDVAPPQSRLLSVFAQVAAINNKILQRGTVWPAFLVGLGSATPPYECIVMLTIIMASGAALGTQIGAFVLYTLILLAVIEIPLIAYLAMPDKTQALIQSLQNVMQKHRHRITQAALSTVGISFVVQGIGSL
jgi:hypothetical protein